jgi:hypothetical protein
MFLIRGCTQEESEGKYKGEDQRFCPGEVDQPIQGRLGSHRRLVCYLVLNPLFLVSKHGSVLVALVKPVDV